MAKTDFMWRADGADLPPIEAHTKARHRATEDYVQDWVETLCGNNIGNRKTITVIDGFCGGGMYQDGETGNEWEGSPIRLIRAVQSGLNIVRDKRSKPHYELNFKFIFIDNKKEHIECLKNQFIKVGLTEYVTDSTKCEFICSEFELVADKIVKEVKARKGSSLFILDPTGYTDVSMQTMRTIMKLGKSEILYTFMIEYISRFVDQRNTKLRDAFSNVLEADGFFNHIEPGSLSSQCQQSYIRNETLRLFRNRGESFYVYSFALLPRQFQVKYYLIHLANNPTAQRVIKNSLWRHNNIDLTYQFHYEVYGLGFRTADYYEENMQIFDIDESNIDNSLNSLTDMLMPYIHDFDQGLPLKILHDSTMQKNPSTFEHYQDFIRQQRTNGEINVLRKGKATSANILRFDDVIVKSNQLRIFDLKQFS